MYTLPERLYERNRKVEKSECHILVEKLQRNVRDMGKGKIILKWISEKHSIKA
jgi:hypothetical protein